MRRECKKTVIYKLDCDTDLPHPGAVTTHSRNGKIIALGLSFRTACGEDIQLVGDVDVVTHMVGFFAKQVAAETEQKDTDTTP